MWLGSVALGVFDYRSRAVTGLTGRVAGRALKALPDRACIPDALTAHSAACSAHATEGASGSPPSSRATAVSISFTGGAEASPKTFSHPPGAA